MAGAVGNRSLRTSNSGRLPPLANRGGGGLNFDSSSFFEMVVLVFSGGGFDDDDEVDDDDDDDDNAVPITSEAVECVVFRVASTLLVGTDGHEDVVAAGVVQDEPSSV